MAEDAQHAVDALNEAENSYKNLEETINSYTEARDNIDSLTQGTEEFKNAVIEANEVARELIELYGIASRYNANTGLIEIDNEELDKAIELEQMKLENARVSNVAAQSNKIMAASDLSNAKIAENENKSYLELIKDNQLWGTAGAATGAGAATASAISAAGATLSTSIGAAISAAFGPIVLATVGIGASLLALKAGLDYWSQNSKDEDQIAALESLQDAYTQSGGNFEVAIDSLSETEKSLIDSLGLTDNELANLCSEVSANTAAVL